MACPPSLPRRFALGTFYVYIHHLVKSVVLVLNSMIYIFFLYLLLQSGYHIILALAPLYKLWIYKCDHVGIDHYTICGFRFRFQLYTEINMYKVN